LFDTLCEANTVPGNLVDGMKRPNVASQEGSTPEIGDHQASALLAAPDPSNLQGLRDRAILATLLYHGPRRAELCALHPAAAAAIAAHLNMDGHGDDKDAPLFYPVSNNTRDAGRPISPDGVHSILAKYAGMVGITSLPAQDGHSASIPLSKIAALSFVPEANQISRENGKRRVAVTANVRG
jgi:integrase/recombinase XerD